MFFSLYVNMKGTTLMAVPKKFPRQRKRYLAFKVEGQATRGELEHALQQIGRQHGLQVKLVVERYDTAQQQGLIKARHTNALKLRELLQEPQQVHGRQITIKTMGTSGTIKTAVKKYLQK